MGYGAGGGVRVGREDLCGKSLTPHAAIRTAPSSGAQKLIVDQAIVPARPVFFAPGIVDALRMGKSAVAICTIFLVVLQSAYERSIISLLPQSIARAVKAIIKASILVHGPPTVEVRRALV